ncbi:MAG: hypothetical protein QM783_05595 [Phycisphaerales bacterium]
MQPETYTVHWREQAVGLVVLGRPDMWYVDGSFTSDGGEASKRFVALASTLEPKSVEAHPPSGTRVLLKNDDPAFAGIHALVLSLKDGVLFMRMVFMREAVELLVAKVK